MKEINKSLLKEPEEIKLAALVEEKTKNAEKFLADLKYSEQLMDASELCGPLNDFADNVRVNVGNIELRKNRLLLLQKTKDLLNKVADFSKLQL